MTNQGAITLPGGYWANGSHWRNAELRELTGEDHMFFIEECRGLLPAQWVTEVLTRCVTRLGPNKPTRDAILSLTVGDREALLLQLRRLTSGDRIPCVLTCASPDCSQKLEIELSAAGLLLSPYQEVREWHELRAFRDDGVSTVICFRLPTGLDQQAAAALARTDTSALTDLLLQRCVKSVVSSDGAEQLRAEMSEQLSARMAELDGQAEITLLIKCKACGSAFSIIFDTASYLFQELEAGMKSLYREVHMLAYHYHWSAREILSMTAGMRRRFLKLLEDQLTQETAQ